MRSYSQEIAKIEKMLEGFVESSKIDANQLSLMDNVIKWSEEDQIKVLNNSYLALDVQRLFFGAIRNVNVSMKSMKEKLKGAATRRENPGTAELALELMPSFSNLASYVDLFIGKKGSEIKLDNVTKFSRILYKKAKSYGFYQDVASQLKEAGVTDSQIESFIDSFSRNIAQELDIEEEVSSTVESGN